MPVKLIKTGNTIESVIEVRVFGVVEGAAGGLEATDEFPAAGLKGSGISLPKKIRDEANSTFSSIEISRMVGRGMNGSYLQRLSEGIPRKVLAATLGTEMSNFSKLYKRTLSKIQTDEINDLSLFWAELREFFDGNDGLIDEWLKAPTPALSGAEPVELLSTIVGRQTLRKSLEAMRYGDFA